MTAINHSGNRPPSTHMQQRLGLGLHELGCRRLGRTLWVVCAKCPGDSCCVGKEREREKWWNTFHMIEGGCRACQGATTTTTPTHPTPLAIVRLEMASQASQQPAWTRVVRFVALEDGLTYAGEPLLAPRADIGQAFAAGSPALQARVLARDDVLDASVRLTDVIRTVQRLLPPLDPRLAQGQLGTIRALGANFVQPGQDAAEAKQPGKRPALPIVFYKPPSSVVGHGDAIRLPREAADQTDWEVELVVVIGKACRNVSREQAFDYVLGYTLSNDVSARQRMFAVPQWGLGKSFDTYLPLGPCIVHASAIHDPDNVQLRTVVNGATMQDGNTRDMLFGVAETIEWLSQG